MLLEHRAGKGIPQVEGARRQLKFPVIGSPGRLKEVRAMTDLSSLTRRTPGIGLRGVRLPVPCCVPPDRERPATIRPDRRRPPLLRRPSTEWCPRSCSRPTSAIGSEPGCARQFRPDAFSDGSSRHPGPAGVSGQRRHPARRRFAPSRASPTTPSLTVGWESSGEEQPWRRPSGGSGRQKEA